MKIADVPFGITDWAAVTPTHHPGETGSATWRTQQFGEIRVRTVEYSAGYLADHWCERGHAIHVLEGELSTELRDGRSFLLHAGQSYIVGTNDGAHRSRTLCGARLFIVD